MTAIFYSELLVDDKICSYTYVLLRIFTHPLCEPYTDKFLVLTDRPSEATESEYSRETESTDSRHGWKVTAFRKTVCVRWHLRIQRKKSHSGRLKTSLLVCCQMENMNVPWRVDLELSLLIINKVFILQHSNLVVSFACYTIRNALYHWLGWIRNSPGQTERVNVDIWY